MWEISEGHTKFLYTTKLVPSKDLGKHCSSQHYSLNLLFITTLFIESILSWHYSLTSMSSILFYFIFYHSLSALEHALIFLKCMVNEHVCMNLVSLSKDFSPH